VERDHGTPIFVIGALICVTGAGCARFGGGEQVMAGRDGAAEAIAAQLDTHELDEEEAELPRIPVPHFGEEPLTTVAVRRIKRRVVFAGDGLRLNGRHQDKAVAVIRGVRGTLTHRGRPLPEGSTLSADGRIALQGLGVSYPGTLIVHHRGSHILVVNEVPLERYIQGVIAGELPKAWPAEAYKAQAVAARSYALARMALKGGLYALEASVLDQVYRGGPEEKAALDAVLATRGEVLVQANGLVESRYHSTCGGITERFAEVWPELGVTHDWRSLCATCTGSPAYGWSTNLTYDELTKALAKGRRVRGLAVTARSESGRARTIEVRTSKGAFEISGRRFRRALGTRRVKSTLFDVAALPGAIRLKGRGYGHGVGMCQWGARGMAEAGHSYVDILGHYYRGASVHRAYR
jgi:stage II sporulation protein D